MTIELKAMDATTFQNYISQSIEAYANEHIRAGNWQEEEALEKAKRQFEQLLPNGLNTKGHLLFSIYHKHEAIGHLWLHVNHQGLYKKAFIYDIELLENYRGKGLGKATLEALDQYAQKLGIKEIRLHVFAHNKRAIALYQKMDYKTTDYHMMKTF
ncbi:ribosomal protein S18 acetylase RimI-like enzyme [Pullulanibacillus pueri]|uniref:Putative N-acetyltransferase YycN n=1 Tax=Pullulanibacillus pueri TaxID=1437324 RepID=A0A8J2ZS30_9BACL|nr:GNAT family N-acetyltransferase [Pullulanibacillus pueri]MBM7680464.1 ribosomal protein S18 acetylase RimI-like enzyme [Pullulanibacillus pueri]GGH74961.1 putative N-acetyltransferase YycN [Pullulanibacillus pueri]